MPQSEPRKIVYLLGAGATHAELATVVPSLDTDAKAQRNLGLLMSHVSTRVIEIARSNPSFLRGIEFLEPHRVSEPIETQSGPTGSLNIELLISLIENSKIHRWDEKTRLLKRLVRRDIESRLTPYRRSRFHLHRALLELHENATIKEREELVALVSLNYDTVIDEAYKEFHGRPNYCLSLGEDVRTRTDVPLLKLHGSFNWANGITIRGRRKSVDTIPLGSNKNYLHAPYNFIWNRAFEVLIECDTLRVIGCSLSQNDAHLVDLLFRAYIERTPGRMKTFEMELICGDTDGEAIRKNYGFFPGIKTLTRIVGEFLIGDVAPANPFKTWLTARTVRLPDETLKRTRYLRRLR